MVRASLPALSYPESMHVTVQSHARVAACWWSSSRSWCLAVGRPRAMATWPWSSPARCRPAVAPRVFGEIVRAATQHPANPIERVTAAVVVTNGISLHSPGHNIDAGESEPLDIHSPNIVSEFLLNTPVPESFSRSYRRTT
jgi:hypothetical protein